MAGSSIQPLEAQMTTIGARITPVSLELPDGLRFNTWASIFDQLLERDDALQWWIADAAAYGEKWFRKDYGPALERYERETLYMMAWVARSVEALTRIKVLSFAHHRAVAGLEPDMQAAFLADAFEDNCSVRELRERIARWRDRDVNSEPVHRWSVRPPADLVDMMARAAERAGAESPTEWALAVLEREARQILALEAA